MEERSSTTATRIITSKGPAFVGDKGEEKTGGSNQDCITNYLADCTHLIKQKVSPRGARGPCTPTFDIFCSRTPLVYVTPSFSLKPETPC